MYLWGFGSLHLNYLTILKETYFLKYDFLNWEKKNDGIVLVSFQESVNV